MFKQIKKSNMENKSRAVAYTVVQQKTGAKQGVIFVDNRPEAKSQKSLQLKMNLNPSKDNRRLLPERMFVESNHNDEGNVIQRIKKAIGFEFQTGVHIMDNASQLEEGKKLKDYGRWWIVADEVARRCTGDLEFVTKETKDQKELTSTMDSLTSYGQKLQSIKGEDEAYFDIPYTKLPGDVSSPTPPLNNAFSGVRQDINVTFVPHPISAAPQATINISLESITRLFEHIMDPVIKGSIPIGSEDVGSEDRSLSGESHDEGRMLTRIPGFVKKAIEKKIGEKKLKTDVTDYPSLLGFASLILSYIVNGATATQALDYSKLIAPVMARTDFHSMWKQLNALERNLFITTYNQFPAYTPGQYSEDEEPEHPSSSQRSEEEDEESEHLSTSHHSEEEDEESESGELSPEDILEDQAGEFSNWMMEIAVGYIRIHEPNLIGEGDIFGKEAINRVYAEGYKDDDRRKKTHKGPETSKWLESIVNPEEKKDIMSPPSHGSKSMGKFSASGAVPAILELRRLKKGVALSQWKKYAINLFEVYNAIENQGKVDAQRAKNISRMMNTGEKTPKNNKIMFPARKVGGRRMKRPRKYFKK